MRISSLSSVGVVTPNNLEQLEEILSRGMSTQKLVSVLGQPMNRSHYEDGLEMWTYALSRKHMQQLWDEDIIGLDVRLTNGHVASWFFIYMLRGASSGR